MRSIISLAITASLAAGVVAQPHNHRHFHAKKGLDKRNPDVVVVYESGPLVTAYELGGKPISEEEAKKGIADGLFVVVGETAPSSSPLPPASASKAPKPSPSKDAQFFEAKVEKPTTSATPTPSPTPTPTPTPSPSSQAPPPAATKPSTGGSGTPAGSGVDAEFPSGKIPCSHFPSDYGAVPIEFLGTDGWTGIQKTPNYNIGDAAISYIVNAISGDSCGRNSFCSYACPVGYQKTQWPTAQGSTKQSIGGIYCNNDGFLELTRPEKKTLCEKGAGGVTVQNDLSEQACVCRTDYPGLENMVIPTVPMPGQSLVLTNPLSSDYYIWNNSPTTAQYYVNKKGLSVQDACVWNSATDPTGAGNWAPTNIGVGKAADGNTYISIFNNAPTSTAKLDFNIEIIGDVNSKCSLINGVYSGGGNGCTTAMSGNGKAVIRFFN